MKSLLLGLAALASAQPSEPPADPICGPIAQLDRAARIDGTFERLAAARFNPRLLRHCNVHRGGAICHQNLTPSHVTPASMASRIVSCLPRARVTREREGFGSAETVVTHGRLRFRMAEHCEQRCRAGRIMNIYIDVQAPPAG